MINIGRFLPGEIPEEQFVTTTCHDSEPIEDAMFYAKICAGHSEVDLEHTLILHVSYVDGRDRLLQLFADADA